MSEILSGKINLIQYIFKYWLLYKLVFKVWLEISDLLQALILCNVNLIRITDWRANISIQGLMNWGQSLFVLEQCALFHFHSASTLKQQSAGRHVAPLEPIILIPIQQVFTLTQIPILSFDPTLPWTHNVPHSGITR